ncbi:MAG: acyl--CoA ligase [Flavobacteriia bacterium]|nr:acyl--CoA ligase [Flavobacteriia bacterium]MBH2022887.1 acyl--CoA ligase [Flavobacteriales bacterium]
MNDLDWISKWADYQPKKIAVSDLETGEDFTYLDLHQKSNAIVSFLKEHQKEGDRIVVIMEHSPFLIALFSACQRLGLILVPLNYKLSSSEIHDQLKDCEPSLVIYSEFFEHLLSLSKDSFTSVKLADFNDDVKNCKESHSASAFLINAESPIFLFYTSGTTSTPKGVLYTNKMLFWNSLNTTMQLGITAADITLSILPPYHTSGWNVFLTPILHNGGKIVMLSKFNAQKVIYHLEKEKITLLMGLPTVLQMITKYASFHTADFSHLRYIISGGEAISKEIIEQWKYEKNVDIRPGYGLTEAGPSITSLHQDFILTKPNSIGKPNFYVHLDVVDKKGNSLPHGEMGELKIKGEIVTPGYWNNSVATQDKIKNSWFHTGDLACRDSEGFFYLMGRMDDMYISGGENIFPQEVEKVLHLHPAVARAIIIPVSDEIWGAKGVAFLKTVKETSEVELREFLKDKLARFKQPKEFVLLEEFPVTGFGKISRKDLTRIYLQTKQKIGF